VPSRDWRVRIEDILDAVRQILSYAKGMDSTAFAADRKTLDAVIRNLEIIGEAARHVPDRISDLYPAVPWQDMRDMRNLLIHEYFGFDVEVVWQTVATDLAPLLLLLQVVLDESASGDD